MLTTQQISEVQDLLCKIGFLDPIFSGSRFSPFRPVASGDGVWGLNTQTAVELWLSQLAEPLNTPLTGTILETLRAQAKNLAPLQIVQQPLDTPLQAFARRVAAYLQRNGLWIARHPGMLNIVYLEGVDENGRENDDAPDRWNDRRLLLRILPDGTPEIVHNAAATTEPGKFYTDRPLHAAGVARLGLDEQWKAWQMGYHNGRQPALRQVRPVRFHRDLNRDGKRSPKDPIEVSITGINQHTTARGFTGQLVGKHSAGCLVGRDYEEHLQFLELLKTDPRYRADSKYVFLSALLHGGRVAQLGT